MLKTIASGWCVASLSVALLLFRNPECQGQPTSVVPPASKVEGGTNVIPSDWKKPLMAKNKWGNKFGKPTESDAGIVVTTVAKPPSIYGLDIGIPVDAEVSRGQVMLLRFAARSIKAADMTGQTQLHLYYQKTSPDWFKSMQTGISLDETWQRFDVPFVVRGEYRPGESGIYFAYGFAPQVAEIADVHLLSFPVGTDLATLPRTQRLAGEVDSKHYEKTVARIGEFRKGLAGRIGVDADVVKLSGKVLHVSSSASSSGNGSEATPYSTIQAAVDAAAPGDTILVGAGTYDRSVDSDTHTRIKISGRPDAWISVRAAPGAKPRIVSSAWKAFELTNVHYIEIRGLTFEGIHSESNNNSGNGIAVVNRSTHIRVIDNVVHGFGGAGIYSMQADYVHFEGNTVHNTSKGSDWGNSAISLYQCINSDGLTSGYKNVIRRNICYDNENLRPFKFGGGSITDGNGIIIDDARHTQNKSKDTPYQGWTLIENNLIYANGGRGVHSYKSDRIDVINNTLYMNQGSKDIRNGELTASVSSQMNFINNIVVARENLRGNGDDRSKEIIFARNLFFNTDDVIGGREPILAKSPNFAAASMTAVDPDGFRVKPGSPAIGAGVPEVAPPDDLFGKPRVGRVDLGAIQNAAK